MYYAVLMNEIICISTKEKNYFSFFAEKTTPLFVLLTNVGIVFVSSVVEVFQK